MQTLQDIPLADLLHEIERRCHLITEACVPPWCRPALIAVAAEEGILLEDLMNSRGRTAGIVGPRMLAMAVLEHLHPIRSLSEIGGLWNLDHGTVIHAREKIAVKRHAEQAFLDKWDRVITAAGGQGHCRSTRSRMPLRGLK